MIIKVQSHWASILVSALALAAAANVAAQTDPIVVLALDTSGDNSYTDFDTPILDGLTNLGVVTYTEVSPEDFASVDLDLFDVLYVPSTFETQWVYIPAQAALNALVARSEDIAAFIASGHGVVALSEPIGTGCYQWLPQPLDATGGYGSVTIVDIDHPVMAGLTSASLSSWGSSVHNAFSDTGDYDVLANTTGPYPVTVARSYGCGRIVATGQDPDFHYWYNFTQAKLDFVRNAIEWVAIPNNQPPTAVAGSDQSVHAGDSVCLDGNNSWDDNTPTPDLAYAWTLTDPEGGAAPLTGANSPTPCFTANLPGTYTATLIVTDEQGMDSAPDEVMISSSNLPPTAKAGDDFGGVVGLMTTLDGSASFDPDQDPLTFSWSFFETPPGSLAEFQGAGSVDPSFVPDLPGVYVVRLIVNDGYEDSPSDDVTVTVITGMECAENLIMEAMDYIGALPPEAVTTKGNRTALLNHLSQAIRAAQEGDYDTARGKVSKALNRLDGCIYGGAPDGNGPGRDWIVSCPDQVFVYALLDSAWACLPQ